MKNLKSLKATLDKTLAGVMAIVAQFPDTLKAQLDPECLSVQQALAEFKLDGDEDAVLAQALDVMTRTHAVTVSSLDGYRTQFEAAQQSLNRLAELDQRLANGDLVEKAKVAELLEGARQEGATQALAQVQVLAERREKITAAQLPVPADALLAGTDEEFTARLTTATARQKEIAATGIALNGVFGQSIWAPEAEYQRDLKLVKEVRPASSPTPNPMAQPGAPRVYGMI